MTPAGLVLALAVLAQDSTALALRRRVWSGLTALERAEQHLTSRHPAVDTSAARILADVRSGLDTMVFATPWGPAELDQLRLAFPGSALLGRYVARLDERSGQADSALAEVDRLLRRDASDVELLRMRGRLLAATNHPREALDAYTRAYDLAPADDSIFHELQDLSERQGTLGSLLDQIRRLRIRVPASRALADHEIEVSERLGVPR